jgi:Tol biopolymer transport system component
MHPGCVINDVSLEKMMCKLLKIWRLVLVAAIWATGGGLAMPEDAEKKPDEALSLQPTRVLEFTTSEGTWLSLDVSPDGDTIVFELLGDLYTLPVEGGEARRITEGMAFDSQPRFSPDGKRIAFLSDRDGAENVWVAEADGANPRKLSRESGMAELASPCWTPDGRYVIVSKAAEGVWVYELWMYHLQGGAGVQITRAISRPDLPRDQRHNALGATASPDGRYLYYARRTGGFQYNATFPMWQVARRDLVTGDEDILTQAQGSAVRPLLSPDGKQLVYGTRYGARTELRIRDLTSGDDRLLIRPVQRDDQESRFTRDLLPGYAFTPDGGELILSFDGGIRAVRVLDGSVREIPFTAHVRKDMGPLLQFPHRVEEGPVRARLIQDPGLSPDGSRLAFSSLTHLYTLDLPDGPPARLETGHGGFQPAWSPDGRWIAYVTWSDRGGHLWKIPADGSGPPRQLTDAPGFYSDPVWSPDGGRIVALRGSRYMRREAPSEFGGVSIPLELVWVPSEGGEPTSIAPSRGLGKPHFAGDSDRIYVYGRDFFPEDGGEGLVSMRLDGTDRRTHLKVLGKGIYSHHKPVGARDIRIGPDRRWALALVQNQLYLLAVPQVGSTPEVNVESPAVPVKRLTRVGADYFGWSQDGEVLTWAVGSTFHRLPMSEVSFEPPPEGEQKDPGEKRAEPVPEDGAEVTRVVVEAPRHAPQGTFVLRGARVVTMRGDEVIERGDVVVRDNRIERVGPAGGAVPDGARVFDVEGKTIVPGFVDTHAHWLEVRKGVLDIRNWSFLANLAYGVTAGLDVQTMTNDMFAYQDLVDVGEIQGPRAYSTGPGIFSDNNFKSFEEARGVLSRYRDHYRTRNLKSYIVGNRKQRHFVVRAARELEMMPTTEGGLDLKLNLTHAIDGFTGNEHSLPIVPLYEDVVRLFAESGIGYTPTLLVHYGGPFAENYFYTTTEVHDDAKLRRFVPPNIIEANTRRVQWFREDEYAFPETAAQAAKILRAGGLVGVGSHGQLQGLGYHWEMWALARGGMTPLEVLRCATILGAKIIGLEQDLGSIEPGKLADLVVLDRNPLEDIRSTNSVHWVVKNGEIFEGDALNGVWPEENEMAPLWWWDE